MDSGWLLLFCMTSFQFKVWTRFIWLVEPSSRLAHLLQRRPVSKYLSLTIPQRETSSAWQGEGLPKQRKDSDAKWPTSMRRVLDGTHTPDGYPDHFWRKPRGWQNMSPLGRWGRQGENNTKTFSVSGTFGWFLGSIRQNIWNRDYSGKFTTYGDRTKKLGTFTKIFSIHKTGQCREERMGCTLSYSVKV